jgi:hypothetical protein
VPAAPPRRKVGAGRHRPVTMAGCEPRCKGQRVRGTASASGDVGVAGRASRPEGGAIRDSHENKIRPSRPVSTITPSLSRADIVKFFSRVVLSVTVPSIASLRQFADEIEAPLKTNLMESAGWKPTLGGVPVRGTFRTEVRTFQCKISMPVPP